jgi:hypothetical protein
MPNNSSMLRRVLLAGLLLQGCAAEPMPAPPVAEITVSAAAFDAAPRLTLTPIATLCDAVGGDCELSAEVAAEPDVAGGVLLWEFAKAIRRYDNSGHRQADLGRKGKGPGEYEIAVAAGIAEGGIAVADIATLRIARFDSAGTFLRFDPLRNLPQTTRAVAFVGGALVVFSIQPLSDGSGSAFRAMRLTGGKAADTLALHQLPGHASSAGELREMPALFSAQPSWKALADGAILFTPGSTYDIWEYRGGVPTRHLRVEHAARAVEQSELDRETATRRARSMPPQMRAAVDDAIRRAATVHPSITQLVGLPDGGLLVREAEDITGDSVRWTRFDRDWNAAGYFIAGTTTRILLVQRDRMLMQEQHDVQTAVRWFGLP